MLAALIFLSSFLTLVELNCENLFDTRHDVGKEDRDFVEGGSRHWTTARYWQKLNSIGKEILSCSDELPDMVALCEVENDTVLHDLTRRSLLRNAGYEYLMTESPDLRGIDVALLYRPSTLSVLCYDFLSVPPCTGMNSTRDILYVKGLTLSHDTIHIFVVHAPSRTSGELATRPFRMTVANVVCEAIEQLHEDAKIILVGDFNDYVNSPALKRYESLGLINVSKNAKGRHGVGGTYRYKGYWQSLDHIFMSPSLSERVDTVYINDAAFLLEKDDDYGCHRPFRTFNNKRTKRGGFSDHLPLVVRIRKK